VEMGELVNLQSLQLFANQISGPIPSSFSNLSSINELMIHFNQLSGLIPEEICSLDLTFSSNFAIRLDNNNLCPPYPSCIEDYVGEQDTSGCD